ncbi:MAG: O-antigen ligase family protein [Actinobacteria bacterium]|nr:O-antigen ligase family protein [Thermoleophilia bacterium]MCB9010739.1 O-antigen ligase family protein [Actinomycetota bacterium]
MPEPDTTAADRSLTPIRIGAVAVSVLVVALGMLALGPKGAAIVLLGLAAVALIATTTRLTAAHVLSVGCVLAMFSGNWSALGFPIGVDRLVVLAGVFMALVAAATDRELRLVARPVHLGLMAASAWAVCSLVLVGAQFDSVALYALLDRFGVVPFLVFFVAPYAFRTAASRRVLVGTLTLMGLYLGAMAVFQRIGPEQLVFPRYILDPDLGIHFDRARGPFLEASANGVVLVMCAAVSTYGLHALSRRWRWWCVAAMGLSALGAALTLTRSVWLAFLLAGAVGMLSLPRLRPFIVPAALGVVAVVAIALAVLPGFANSAQDRAAEQEPVWDRRNLVTASIRIIEDRPLLGVGWSRFPTESPPYFRQADDYPLSGEGLVVHNVPLLYATEIGIAGFALWAVAFGVAVIGPILRRGSPLFAEWRAVHLAILVAWLTVAMFAPLAQALPNMLLMLWAGVTAGTVPWMTPLSSRSRAAASTDAPPQTPLEAVPVVSGRS